MAKIGLTEGFSLIPEGTHVFKITDVKYKEDFGKLEVAMQTQSGAKHIERFSLLKSDGTPIRKATKKLSSWRLENCDVYVTIEPCSMCAGALLWCRVRSITYGAKEPKGGALGSSYHLFEQPNLNHHPLIIGGVLEQEAAQLMTDFFKRKRNRVEMHIKG